jgi:hypothetical protein
MFLKKTQKFFNNFFPKKSTRKISDKKNFEQQYNLISIFLRLSISFKVELLRWFIQKPIKSVFFSSSNLSQVFVYFKSFFKKAYKTNRNLFNIQKKYIESFWNVKSRWMKEEKKKLFSFPFCQLFFQFYSHFNWSKLTLLSFRYDVNSCLGNAKKTMWVNITQISVLILYTFSSFTFYSGIPFFVCNKIFRSIIDS